MRISVTEVHIQQGQKCATRSCPVALAISEVLREDYYVQADNGLIYVLGGDGYPKWLIEMPVSVKAFIARFDYHHAELALPEPFWFDLDLPEWLLKEK